LDFIVVKLLQNFMQKIIKIDEKRSGRDQRSAATSIWQNIISCQQTNDRLREQKLNTRKSFLRLRLNFLKLSSFQQKIQQARSKVL
jgi:hypothetical protein